MTSSTPATIEEIKVLLEETLDRKLGEKLLPFRTEMDTFNKKLEEIYDAIQEVIGVADEGSDRKIQKLRSQLEPRIEKLEHKVFPQSGN